MTNQLDKQHENLTYGSLTAINPMLEVEEGTVIRIMKGNGKWLDKPVKVIRVELLTPYFSARFTRCDKQTGWDLLKSTVCDSSRIDRAEVLAAMVLGMFSVKETLLMMHESCRYGVNHGKDLLRSDIKRLLRI